MLVIMQEKLPYRRIPISFQSFHTMTVDMKIMDPPSNENDNATANRGPWGSPGSTSAVSAESERFPYCCEHIPKTKLETPFPC